VKVTRTDMPQPLEALSKATGYMRADIWRRYGAPAGVGESAVAIRTEIGAPHPAVTFSGATERQEA
jgi:hypothetical protein